MAYDIAILGNSIVDYVVRTEKPLLDALGIKEGSSVPIMHDERIGLERVIGKYERLSGGSEANTAAAFANLGGNVAYVGAVGNDDNGKFFIKDLAQYGVSRCGKIKVMDGYTGVVINLVTGNDRTMRSDLEGSPALSADDIPKGVMRETPYFHTSAYVMLSMPSAFDRCMQMAKYEKITVSFDLASAFVVEKNRGKVLDLVKNYVNVLFANEEEAKALTGLEPEYAVAELGKMADIAVVKLGSKGSLVSYFEDRIVKIPPVPTTVVNTTGAGDSYAGAFLYGLLRCYDAEKCGEMASRYASLVVAQENPRLDRDWRII